MTGAILYLCVLLLLSGLFAVALAGEGRAWIQRRRLARAAETAFWREAYAEAERE